MPIQKLSMKTISELLELAIYFEVDDLRWLGTLSDLQHEHILILFRFYYSNSLKVEKSG